MTELFNFLQQESRTQHPVAISILSHLYLVSIHPFIEGNGRTARLILSYILRIYGFPPVIIDVNRRLEYLATLNVAQTEGNPYNFFKLMFDIINETLDLHIAMAKDKTVGKMRASSR